MPCAAADVGAFDRRQQQAGERARAARVGKPEMRRDALDPGVERLLDGSAHRLELFASSMSLVGLLLAATLISVL